MTASPTAPPNTVKVPDVFIKPGRTEAANIDSKKKLRTATGMAAKFRIRANFLFFSG